MVVKCSTVCLVALAFLCSFCEAQNIFNKLSPQKPMPTTQQQKQTFDEKIKWSYPNDPIPEEKPVVEIERRTPVSPSTVAVQCLEQHAEVLVQRDLFAINQLINSADLSLGSCSAVQETPEELLFQAPLHECGSVTSGNENYIIYTFVLNYRPSALGASNVVRTTQAAVTVECHYPRKHNVSSLALDPIWVSYATTKISDELLYFSLKVVTPDFQSVRSGHEYFLGDTIFVEASVYQFQHAPLRLFVDQCVATCSPDSNSNERYTVIDQGCFVDGRITNSKSRFISRPSENVLRFQLDTFKFTSIDEGQIYITCYLKASLASNELDDTHRACSYTNFWADVSGRQDVCAGCETTGMPPPSNTGVSGSGNGGNTGTTTNTGNTPSTGNTGNTGKNPWGQTTIGNTGSVGGQGSNTRNTGSTIWGSSKTQTRFSSRMNREATKKEVYEWYGVVAVGPLTIHEAAE